MFNRGGFPGQRPMGHPMMTQSGMTHPGMNNPGLNNPGMNNPGMNNPGLNNPGMNNPGMNNPGMNTLGMNNPGMNNPGMNNPGMNMGSMNMPGMNMGGMNMPAMNQQNMNHPGGMTNQGINHSGMNSGMNHPRMGNPGMIRPNMGFSGMNQPAIGLNRMNHPGMNQGGMGGFHPEMKGQGFGMRPGDNPGPFVGGNPEPMGMKPMPVRAPMHSSPERLMGPQTMSQRFAGPNIPARQGQPRMQSQESIPSIVNRVVAHSSDHMMGKQKAPVQEPGHLMKDKQWNALSMFGNLGRDVGMKSQASTLDQMSNNPNRYTNESASSILESFGLSNEDLEELSRYPDDQLTPGNMPSILRDIRLRKVTRSGATPDQGGGRRPGNEMMPSKVIDYGHASKFQYNDRSASDRSYDSSRPEPKPAKVNKEPAASIKKKPEKLPEISMDNKIPTISGSRKPTWQPTKAGRSNNKTLVGEQKNVTSSDVHVSVNVSQMKSPVVTIKTDSEVPATVHKDMKPDHPVAAGNVGYQVPTDTGPAGKGNWIPVLSAEETQKLKRLPTPSMMNDYYAASPRIFPHICSLCNIECKHLKDWIKHQNNTSHIENCRKLSQQYPDWNPHVLSAVRNEDKKDEASSKRSKSKSGSPRRSRRSTSRRRSRKSQSRSPRSSVRTRSRSPRSSLRPRGRSPRRSRHIPRRSRSPSRGARSPRRSISPRRQRSRHRTSSASPDKRAVDAAVQSFIQATKLKSGEKSNNGKKIPPRPANKKPPGNPATKSGKTPGNNTVSSAGISSKRPDGNAGSVKKPGASNPVKKLSNVAPKKSSSSSPASKGPPFNVSYTKKAIVSTAVKKTTPATPSCKKPALSKQPTANRKATSDSPTNEQYNTLNKFINKNNSGKIIHVTNLPDSGYTDQDILKIIQPFGKVCDILLVRSKNEAFLETNFKEAAMAAVNFSKTKPLVINNQQVRLSLAGQNKKPVKSESKSVRSLETPSKPPNKTGKKTTDKDSHPPPKKEREVPPGMVKRYKLRDPQLMESEKCVILLSNLPETQYTVEELCNLAKPFGGVNDVLLLSNYRKAYLELTSRSSADSMIKFYSTFSTHLGGKLLSVSIDPTLKDLKDVDRIFASLIEQASYKITPSIYENFVYLLNIPEKDVSEYDVILIGVRFGKVEHSVILSNKNKAILHMQNASAAKAMYDFLTKYPCTIGKNLVQCSLPSKTKLAEDEYVSFLEEDKPSSDAKSNNDETKVTTEEKAPKDKETSLPTSPISQTEMDVDAAEEKKSTAAQIAPSPTLTKDFPSAGGTGPLIGGGSGFSYVQAAEDDDDDYEEAAEAAEAPDTAPITYFLPVPEVQYEEPIPVSHDLLPEELEVLVSVESDEEECEEPLPFFSVNTVFASSNVHQLATTTSEETKEPAVLDSEPADDIDAENRPGSPEKDSTAVSEMEQDVIPEPSGQPVPEPQPDEADSAGSKESKDTGVGEQVTNKAAESSTVQEEAIESSQVKMEEDTVMETKPESMEHREESSQPPVQQKASDEAVSEAAETAKETEPVVLTSGVSVTRTAKYNPQKGEIFITLSVENQKSAVKTADARKRSSREMGSSGRESSTPKSNSNRSSPTDSACSNPRTSSSGSQKKNGGRHVSPQVTSWSRDRDGRANVRKDERSKGNSSSSRYARSNKPAVRDTRCKEEEDEESFPFNLDEFVTVDEIVEEHTDSKTAEEGPPEVSVTPRKGKRKENEPVLSGAKKSKGVRGDSAELSFVTLDEVGDEEDNTVFSEAAPDPSSQPMLTVDEVHTEDSASRSVKNSQALMTLDEISDEDDVQDVASGLQPSAVPEILAKDQLLTLDEISGEDEEQTTPSEPSKVETEVAKVEDSIAEPQVKEAEPTPQEAPQTLSSQGDVTQSQLLTLDEVKGDDEDDFLTDIECRFLTVDEIGGEEEESDTKVKEVEEPEPEPEPKPKPSPASKAPKTGAKTIAKLTEPSITPAPAAKRGRPRKRPLPVDESRPQTPSAPEKTPTKAKGNKDHQGAADVKESPLPTPEKPDSTTTPDSSKKCKGSGSPAKKKQLMTPSTERAKLGPFNPTVPIGMEFLVPKTGYFCELCSLFYMDEASKLKHCKSMRHYQAVEKHVCKEQDPAEGKS